MTAEEKERFLSNREHRIKALWIGNFSLAFFLISSFGIGLFYLIKFFRLGFLQAVYENWPSMLLFLGLESLLFWSGIILVYVQSRQLGMKYRVIGILCGWIPIVHILALLVILNVTFREAAFEHAKNQLDRERLTQEICKTKYPLLMIHGVFFRDFKTFNYWGRVPNELMLHGAEIYYGNHQSAASVKDSAKELAARIDEILEESHCEKVNIIAHSKGGLDIKTAVSECNIASKIASITTINTPHQGCVFADYLLNKAPLKFKEKVTAAYNSALHAMGDENPDFISAVTDLTASHCAENWIETGAFDYDAAGIFTQSFGSILKKSGSGAFPLNFSYLFVKNFDGPNDGLVGEPSFHWGSRYTLLTPPEKRGISHGDMIDLNRENIRGFDVREFYVGVVADLKNRGF